MREQERRTSQRPDLVVIPAPRRLALRDFQTADREQAIRLLALGRPLDYVEQKGAIFDWQFFQNPDRGAQRTFLVGELGAGHIVALNGLMPARIRYQGNPQLACWSCDTFVSPEQRGHGFGTQLVREVTEAAPVMLGYGISDMSDPIFHKHDWVQHPGVRLLFFHVDEPGVKGHFKNWMSRVARLRKLRIGPRDCEIAQSLTPQLAGELDELWQRSAAGYFSAVERDAAYLRWKYFTHPLHRYYGYGLRRRGALAAFVIARPDPVESVIADYCGPANDVGAMIDIASATLRDLVERGTRRVRCETTHPPLIEALRRVGFVMSRHASRFRVHAPVGSTDPLKGWLLMAGDSDGDVLGGFDREAS